MIYGHDAHSSNTHTATSAQAPLTAVSSVAAGDTSDSTVAVKMKAHIPGTSEHKLKKHQDNVDHAQENLAKDQQKVQKLETKQALKEDKKLHMAENNLHKQQAKAANAADRLHTH
ncbi:hypothetical protein WJX77_005647 [Trebouxia sp. C0004]